MANLQIKGINDELYGELKEMAAEENRSVSQQTLYLLRDYLAKRRRDYRIKTAADVLLELSGSWKDERETKVIIAEIKKGRRNSTKMERGF
jgi:plasmid stability protein